MEEIFIIVAIIILVWISISFIYNGNLNYLPKGLLSRLDTISKLITQDIDIIKELKDNNINVIVDNKEGLVTWRYQSFPDWAFVYFTKQSMITVSCTLLNPKYNMITLWSHFEDNKILLSWSINRKLFSGMINADAEIFLNSLHRYGVDENDIYSYTKYEDSSNKNENSGSSKDIYKHNINDDFMDIPIKDRLQKFKNNQKTTTIGLASIKSDNKNECIPKYQKPKSIEDILQERREAYKNKYEKKEECPTIR